MGDKDGGNNVIIKYLHIQFCVSKPLKIINLNKVKLFMFFVVGLLIIISIKGYNRPVFPYT